MRALLPYMLLCGFMLCGSLGCTDKTTDSAGSAPSGDGEADSGTPEDTTARATLQLQFPLVETELFKQRIGVDHDPVVQEDGIFQLICEDYAGRTFPHCYDEHDGSDYILSGGFDTMDAGSATIVAAAAGVVAATEDGNYDRCHGDIETGGNDCDGYAMRSNYVNIQHETGHITRYLHMMSGSVLVEVGQSVAMGDPLGKVGSSGNSFTPHLHLELQDADGVVIDPYAGSHSQEETFWCSQGAQGAEGHEDELPGLCDAR